MNVWESLASINILACLRRYTCYFQANLPNKVVSINVTYFSETQRNKFDDATSLMRLVVCRVG